jgi:prepilin-type N-terminal cleavage/methylation domain-containing protein/prepilin-type processing-associated H-X9-DG protein
MVGWRFNPRVPLAALALLTSVGLLYFARTDHVPHDRDSRVKPEAFWAAVARPIAAQRPSNIVVYPLHRGVQLVTCTGHPPRGPSVERYFYVKIGSGQPTVEAKLQTMGIAFAAPWWDSPWMQYGPWTCVGIAVALLIIPVFAELVRIAVQEKPRSAPDAGTSPAPEVTEADLEKVRQLDAAMESVLSTSADAPAPKLPAAPAGAATPTPPALQGGPLQAIEPTPEEEKQYRGEFYPVARPPKHDGFTLVELLVVIGVLGVLIALVLPSLSGARRDANQIACAANLRSIGQALAIYEVQNDGLIPASYSYNGQTIINGQQQYTSMGYVHWSSFLYGNGMAPAGAFSCPELEGGGLPPTNTTVDNRLPGQLSETPGAVDQQATRVAYTLNEAVSPRNKFALGFQGALRVYQFVHASSIPHASGTILATEWAQTGAEIAASAGGSGFYLYSHRPVHGFVGLDGTLDMYRLNPATPYRRITDADLDPDPASTATSVTRLEWVGRNHGHPGGYPDQRRTNFLYLDGHVECKTIYETLAPFEWGGKFFTLVPNDDLQP